MTFFVACFLLIGFISYRCWFFARISNKPRPREPIVDTIKQYEDFENIAVQLIEVSGASSHQVREGLEQFYRDFPHPDMRQRLKRVLR
jgi:hypothetical protein